MFLFHFAAKCSDILQKNNTETSSNDEEISQEVEREPSDSSEKNNLPELDDEPEETEGKSLCSCFNSFIYFICLFFYFFAVVVLLKDPYTFCSDRNAVLGACGRAAAVEPLQLDGADPGQNERQQAGADVAGKLSPAVRDLQLQHRTPVEHPTALRQPPREENAPV